MKHPANSDHLVVNPDSVVVCKLYNKQVYEIGDSVASDRFFLPYVSPLAAVEGRREAGTGGRGGRETRQEEPGTACGGREGKPSAAGWRPVGVV